MADVPLFFGLQRETDWTKVSRFQRDYFDTCRLIVCLKPCLGRSSEMAWSHFSLDVASSSLASFAPVPAVDQICSPWL